MVRGCISFFRWEPISKIFSGLFLNKVCSYRLFLESFCCFQALHLDVQVFAKDIKSNVAESDLACKVRPINLGKCLSAQFDLKHWHKSKLIDFYDSQIKVCRPASATLHSFVLNQIPESEGLLYLEELSLGKKSEHSTYHLHFMGLVSC